MRFDSFLAGQKMACVVRTAVEGEGGREIAHLCAL